MCTLLTDATLQSSRTASPKKATYLYYDEEPRFVRVGWHVVVAKARSPDLSIRIALELQQMVDAVGSRPALDPEGVLAASGSNGWQCVAPWDVRGGATAVNSGALQ